MDRVGDGGSKKFDRFLVNAALNSRYGSLDKDTETRLGLIRDSGLDALNSDIRFYW